MFHRIGKKYRETALIKLIALGLVLGIIIAIAAPAAVPAVAVLGDLFVRALKGIAPVLVFVLVMNSDASSSMKPIVRLYIVATFCASLVAVAYSFAFPTTLHLQVTDAQLAPPSGIIEVLHNLILSVVDNPIHALATANYIGILGWACLAGIALHSAGDSTKAMLNDFAKTVTKIVQWVIRFAPFGIMGLVANAIGTSGLGALVGYIQILGVLLAAFFSVALIMNPLIVYLHIHRNPYPLVWTTLKESGLYAFFTRSSAANIPVNLSLCERLGLNEDTYSISIPLGATINMSGAAITIAVLSLAAAHTLGISVDLPTALLLCIVSTIGACGASGVAGGSLLLIPMACSLFGISNDIAMQVVGVGFIIGVIQDSVETALNSAGDVEFAATAEYHQWLKQGKPLPEFLGGKKK